MRAGVPLPCVTAANLTLTGHKASVATITKVRRPSAGSFCAGPVSGTSVPVASRPLPVDQCLQPLTGSTIPVDPSQIAVYRAVVFFSCGGQPIAHLAIPVESSNVFGLGLQVSVGGGFIEGIGQHVVFVGKRIVLIRKLIKLPRSGVTSQELLLPALKVGLPAAQAHQPVRRGLRFSHV